METVLFSEESLQDAVIASFDPTLYRIERDNNNVLNIHKSEDSSEEPFLCVQVKYMSGSSVIDLDYRAKDHDDFILVRKLNLADKKIGVKRRHKSYRIQYNDVSELIKCWNAKVDELLDDIHKIQEALAEDIRYSQILKEELTVTKDYVNRYKDDKRSDMNERARQIDLDFSTFTGKSEWGTEDVLATVNLDPLMYIDYKSGLTSRPFSTMNICMLIQNYAKECISG